MYRFLVLIVCFIVVPNVSAAQITTCQEHQCIAVVDAGSTGSRLHVFSYDTDTTDSPIHVTEIWSKKIKPGFATIEPNANSIDAYLTTLLAGAPIYASNISLYFYATAGMRLVPPTKQKMYYKELQHWFAQQSEWQLIDSKTITGNEEAIFDWLAVNYKLGALQSGQNKSIGVMDMGGASVQIAFPVQKSQEGRNSKTQVELTLYGQHFNLSVHSFLGLGQTEMSHQFLNSTSCFSNEFPLPDGDIGRGNAQSCEQEVSSLMNGVHGVNTIIQPLLAANPVDTWYTIGGINNMATSDVFHFENNKFTNKRLLADGDNKICQQQWQKLDSQYPNDDFIYQYCLFSAYYYALMVDGYGLYPEETVNFLPSNENIDWTMGVVLHHEPGVKEAS